MVLFFSLAIEIAIVLWVFEKRNKIIQSGYSISARGNQIFFLLCCIVPIFLVAFIVGVLFFRKKKRLVRLSTLIVLFFIGFMAMQFQTEFAQSCFIQAVFDDIQGGHFFGDKEDGLAAIQAGGNQVGDGLGLAGAGRSLYHKIFALNRIYQRAVLGTVGIINQGKIVMNLRNMVNIMLFRIMNADIGMTFLALIAEQFLDNGVFFKRRAFWPVGWIQILIHRLFGEIQ